MDSETYRQCRDLHTMIDQACAERDAVTRERDEALQAISTLHQSLDERDAEIARQKVEIARLKAQNQTMAQDIARRRQHKCS